ncbi:MAG: methyltransferase domain-containing protein [Chloroflexota bacterium]
MVPNATSTARKPYKGLAMEGVIATWYANNTRGDVRGYRTCAQSVTDRLAPGSRVLEVAPGPGYLAIQIAKLGDYQVTGLDISHSFVRIASENARRAGLTIDFQHGDAARMPFPDASFDFVVCRAAFKNFTDPIGAIDEIYRVLRPGGQASIFDLRKDASLTEIDAEVRGMRQSWLNALLTRLTFRFMLLKTAYTTAALERLVAASRFGAGEIRLDGIGFDLRLTKSPVVGSEKGAAR